MWWDSEALIFQNNQFFFKEDDELVFSMGELEIEDVSSKFSDFPKKYRENMYRSLRRRTEWIETELGEGVYPVFKLNDDKTDVKKRIFVWDLSLGVDPDIIDFTDYIDLEEDRPPRGGSRPSKPKEKPKEKPSKPKEDKPRPTPLADKNKNIELVLKQLELGIITKEEAKAKIEKVDNMYEEGGII